MNRNKIPRKKDIDLDNVQIDPNLIQEVRYHPLLQLTAISYSFVEDLQREDEARLVGVLEYTRPNSILDLNERIEELRQRRSFFEDKYSPDHEELKRIDTVLGYTIAFRDQTRSFARRIISLEAKYNKKLEKINNKRSARESRENDRYKKKLDKLTANMEHELEVLVSDKDRDINYVRNQTKNKITYVKFLLGTTIPATLTYILSNMSVDDDTTSFLLALLAAVPAALYFKGQEYQRESKLSNDYELRRSSTIAEFELRFEEADERNIEKINEIANWYNVREDTIEEDHKTELEELVEDVKKEMVLITHMWFPNCVDLDSENPVKKEVIPATPKSTKSDRIV